ncbi:MAG TPA: DUF748 domain-containing protein [Syntrophales bacterium]|nr:DUF748 domain-containing protein [Syntrophales bacterium]
MSRRKKLLILCAAVVVVIVAALAILVGLGNRIIKARLEQALGDGFSVEAISIGWGHVEVVEPRLLRDGEPVASAHRIFLRSDVLDLFKPGLSISRVLLVEPFLTAEIGPDGAWMLPFPADRKQEPTPGSGAGPVTIKEVVVRDGTFVFRDRRLPAPNSIQFRKMSLSLGRVAYPPKGEPSRFEFSLHAEGKLLSGSISGSGTIHAGTWALNGWIQGENLVLRDTGPAGPVSHVQTVTASVSSEGLPLKPLVLTDLTLKKPFLRLESDRKGKIIDPLPGLKGGKKNKGAAITVEVKNLAIEGGKLVYYDGQITRPPYAIPFTDISLSADTLSVPYDTRKTDYRLSARIPGKQGTGILTSSGNTMLKTHDTRAKVTLRGLDLTSVRPYLVKKGDVDVSRGFFDLDVDLTIRNRQLHAPAHSVLRDLRFETAPGAKDEFLGLPRSMVVKALETGDDRIEVDFTVEGSLDNPKFDLQEDMVTRFTIGLARHLGLSVVETGESVIIQSGEMLKGVGNVIKQLFK